MHFRYLTVILKLCTVIQDIFIQKMRAIFTLARVTVHVRKAGSE